MSIFRIELKISRLKVYCFTIKLYALIKVVGFEPTKNICFTDLQSVAFNHSAIPFFKIKLSGEWDSNPHKLDYEPSE